jgi:hypothetical protein
MTFLDALPDDYQFTKQDMEKHWELFPRCVTPSGPLPTVTQDEFDFYNLTDEADRLSRIIKRMPTMLELKNYNAGAQRERARLASWKATYVFNQKDLAEYQAMIAREEFGPMMVFMAAMATIRETTGNFPSVAEVRAYCANQATS